MPCSAPGDGDGSAVREIGRTVSSPAVDRKGRYARKKKDRGEEERKEEKETVDRTARKVDLEA